MFGLKNIQIPGKRWAQRLRTQHIQKQQWSDASDTELRKLARAPSDHTQDTSYRPHSMHGGEANTSYQNPEPTVEPNSLRRYTSGWRFGAINGAISVSVVFFINLVVTIAFSARKDGILYDGDCDRASKLNIGLHLLINILSTVLLSSSNYCMQCLSAPTRREIDDAHSKGNWLDVGIQSIHNLRNISRKRAVVWVLLGLSSLPLHLFYNSAVFLSISSNDYFALSVRESFINSPACADCAESFINRTTSIYGREFYQLHSVPVIAQTLYEMARNKQLDRLSNVDCIREYAEPIQTKRRNVLLVAADNKMPAPNVTADGRAINIYAYNKFLASSAKDQIRAMNSYGWICSDISYWTFGNSSHWCSTLLSEINKAPDNWRVGETGITFSFSDTPTFPIDYCLSESAEPRCKVQFALSIAILVTILNFFKAVLIFYTAIGTKENPLMTMGDAVASFLEKRDETTKNMCLLSVRDVKSHKHYFPAGPKVWTGKQRRFKDVTSRTRRTVTFIFLFVILIAIAALLKYGVQQLPVGTSRSIAGLASLGYGTIDARTIMSYQAGLSTIGYILVANLAQPVLSFLYFSYNGLFTAMLLGYEWVSFAHSRKGLRVSRPAEGAQRSTYFLQLPYRFALPLMALSGVLHWLVSQSIFLVAIDVYDFDGTHGELTLDGDRTGDFKSTGYSPIAIFTTIMLGAVMTLAAIGIGYMPFKEGMNVAGSCSAAMSAACHEVDEVDGFDAARSKVQWGVATVNTEGVGHCTFSTKEVQMPKAGELYAGRADIVASVRERRLDPTSLLEDSE